MPNPDSFTNRDWIERQRRDWRNQGRMDYQGYRSSQFYADDAIAEALLEMHLAHVSAVKAMIGRMEWSAHRAGFSEYVEHLDAAYTDSLKGEIASLKRGMDEDARP